jgi:hypothetical protein
MYHKILDIINFYETMTFLQAGLFRPTNACDQPQIPDTLAQLRPRLVPKLAQLLYSWSGQFCPFSPQSGTLPLSYLQRFISIRLGSNY